MLKVLKIITLFIICRILYPIIKKFLKSLYSFAVVATIYNLYYMGSLIYNLQDKAISYAESRGFLKGDLVGDVGILGKFLKKNDLVTVKTIRELGFSANKSVNVRKNLEKFGIIKTNPQMDNRGQVIANEDQIDSILGNLKDNLFQSDPVMINNLDN